MREVRVPRLNPNDETCMLLEWYRDPGQPVSEGDAIALLETSKASVDLEAEGEGVLHIVAEAGQEPKIGEVIAYLFDSEQERAQFVETGGSTHSRAARAMTVTRKARELIDAHGISEARLLGLGKRIIKTGDVLPLIDGSGARSSDAGPVKLAEPGAEPAPAQGQPLSRRQVAVGRTVSLSHREIPRAYLAVRVWCDALIGALERKSEKEGVEIGLVEHVIWSCARLRPSFPLFFGSLRDESTFVPAATANIGVTLDVGKGLFVPVLYDVESLSLADVARVLADYKFKAFRDSFDESDLEGGCLSVSINTDADVVISLPVIMPGQVAMVSLTAVIEQPWLSPGQSPAIEARRLTQVGVAYDHRVVNGADAVAFCRALKASMERPEEIENA